MDLLFTFGAGIPLGLIVLMTHNLTLALAVSSFSALLGSAYVGPMYALVQGLAGPKIRATAAAIFMLVANLIGLSLGPVLAGLVSDQLTALAGRESLRWSLVVMMLPSLVSLPFFFAAARTVKADLEEAERA